MASPIQISELITYLPQHGILSEMFIPGTDELPEHWMTKFLPFNFPGIPTWGNAQFTVNCQKPFLCTAINMHFDTSFPGGDILESVTVATPGVGMTPGVYAAVITGGGGRGASVRITVSGDGTVHAGGAVVLFRGEGYTSAPAITAPLAAGGAPAATFTANLELSGLGPLTGSPSIQIYQNHRKVQLQLAQKTLLAPGLFGTGSNPGYLRDPYLFDANDAITVECSYTSVFPGYEGASNTDPNYLYCYLTMIGGEPR